jgi:hypothetical protein
MAEKKLEKVEVVAEQAVVAEAKPIVVKEKFVKIIPKNSGLHYIGGTWYDLEKDKEVEVPEDAKRVLKEAGAIYL